jgi:hypothetical protein
VLLTIVRAFAAPGHKEPKSSGTAPEFLDHLGVAEIGRSRITRAAERDRDYGALFPRERFILQ